MYRMPIYFNKLKYRVTKYSLRAGKVELQRKHTVQHSNEVCIGNDLSTLNNPKYNKHLIERLTLRVAKKEGCIIEFLSLEEITSCGHTNMRFN